MNGSASAADFLAAERTFLAWIRTGLALMGLGFVVARFGLFLQAMQLEQPKFPLQPYGLSFWFGTVLILLGVAVLALCAFSHIRLVHRLARGEAPLGSPSTLAVALAVALALLGLAMAVYLISVRPPSPSRVSQVKVEPR
jgi:putative membrane protein